MQRTLITLLLLASCGGAVSEAHGQIALRTGSFANGGGMLSNTTYAAAGTIGQTIIGRSAGTTYATSAGFWGNGGVILDVEELPAAETSGEFALRQNYPNPFNPATKIGFEVSGPGIRVKIGIYDLVGREVAVILDERKEAGRYEVKWHAENRASGVYVCRMIAGDYMESRLMILMK